MNKIVRNFLSMFTGNIFGRALMFLFYILIARYYSQDVFGSVNFANSFITYFLMMSSMGITSYAILLISKNKNKNVELFNKILSSRIVLGIISLFILVLFLVLSDLDKQSKIIIGILGITIITDCLNVTWFYNANQELKYVSRSIVIQNIIQFILICVVILVKNRNPYMIPIILSFGNIVSSLYLLFCVSKIQKFQYKFTFHIYEFIQIIKNSFPFFFSGVFATINCNIDTIIIGITENNVQVGLYNSAYKIINILILCVNILFTPIYPVMIELISEKKWEKFNMLITGIKKIIYLLVMPLTIGGVILSKNIIVLLFGKEYATASTAFSILLISVFILYLRECYGYILSSCGAQKEYMYIVSISSTVNVLLNIIIIPRYGIAGASLTTVISEIINFIGMKSIANRKIVLNLFKFNMWKILLATIIMSIFTLIMKINNINVIINIIISIISYVLCLFMFKIVTEDEMKLLLRKSY